MFHDIEFLVVIDAAVDVVTEVSWVFFSASGSSRLLSEGAGNKGRSLGRWNFDFRPVSAVKNPDP